MPRRHQTHQSQRRSRQQRVGRSRQQQLGWSRQQRLAWNFIHYLDSLVDRLGINDGQVQAQRHNGRVEYVVFVTNGRAGSARVKTIQPRPSRCYRPHQVQYLLEQRLSRLLRNCNYDFGSVTLSIRDGRVADCDFTIKIRPGEKEILRFFNG